MDTSSPIATVAVFGSSILREDDPAYLEIRQLGEELARARLAVMTGGYDGAMAAASRGAHEAGGHVIGVTVEMFEKRGPVNSWVHERIHTPSLFARLEHLMQIADAFVVVTGSIGTLTELFLAWTVVGVSGPPYAPIVLMGAHWREWIELHRRPEFVPHHLFQYVQVADTPAEAARLVSAGLQRVREAERSEAGRS